MPESPVIPWAKPDDYPQPIIAHPSRHVMRESLVKYVASKIHPDIDNAHPPWSRIVIKGSYERQLPFRVSPTEKNKTFNYERPTTRTAESDTLEISCFPGRDYVFHYASVVATHLSLSGRDPAIVQMHHPSVDACYSLFLHSNLRQMGPVHTVVIGYVAQLCGEQTEWETGPPQKDEPLLFGWHKILASSGEVISYLGCTTTIWGDIAGQLVLALHHLSKVRHVLYVAKGGSLRPADLPNHLVATGNVSVMHDRLTWPSALKSIVQHHSNGFNIHEGTQVNVPSPLVEDFEWLARWKGEARWVDCEMGYIARACNFGMVRFDYCMVISDNVAVESDQNLTNEKQLTRLSPRQTLFRQLRNLLDKVISGKYSENVGQSAHSVAISSTSLLPKIHNDPAIAAEYEAARFQTHEDFMQSHSGTSLPTDGWERRYCEPGFVFSTGGDFVNADLRHRAFVALRCSSTGFMNCVSFCRHSRDEKPSFAIFHIRAVDKRSQYSSTAEDSWFWRPPVQVELKNGFILKPDMWIDFDQVYNLPSNTSYTAFGTIAPDDVRRLRRYAASVLSSPE